MRHFEFRLTGWLYSVLLPYFIPLLLAIYPMVKIFLKIKNGAGGCASERERSQYQIVLSISLGYFFFHFLYYLMWLGRQIEAVTLEKTKFRQLLGLHVWYIARPLFSCINLGKSNNSLLLNCACAFYKAVGSSKNLGCQWNRFYFQLMALFMSVMVQRGIMISPAGSVVLAGTTDTQTR